MARVKCYLFALVLLYLLLVGTLSLAQSCGKRKVVNQLIVNGNEANDGHWPWHVTLFHNNGPSFVYACGGTVLDHNTVLTAAHCLTTSNGIMARELLIVHVGRNRLRAGSNRAQEHEAFELIVHPEYNINRIPHDIALIKLTTDITYTDYIQPVCLWNRGEDLNAIVGAWGTVIGFGRDEAGNVSNSLREASIPVVSHITCIESNRNAFANHLTSNMFCAGNRDGIGACNGDSGGGLFFKFNDVWYIRGVVSFTKAHQSTLICDKKEYTVFTDVAKYLQWIRQHMRATDAQPTVTWVDANHKIRFQSTLTGKDKKGVFYFPSLVTVKPILETGVPPAMISNDINRKIGLLPMSTCGPNPYANRKESLKPTLARYPWVGLLEHTVTGSIEKEALCHATLISDLYLITAIDCAIPYDNQYKLSSVRLREYDRNTTVDCAAVDGKIVCLPPVQILRIESVITHKEYNTEIYANDIALIRLQDRADTSQSNVKPICLPVTNELRSQESTYQYILTAWELRSNLLKMALVEVMNSTQCRYVRKYITNEHICIKQKTFPSCDWPLLGAPLQLVQEVQGRSRYVLQGVFSLGKDQCLPEIPDVYTNVASYVNGILENMEE